MIDTVRCLPWELSHYVALYLCCVMFLEGFFLSLYDLRLIQSSKLNSSQMGQAFLIRNPCDFALSSVSWLNNMGY